MSYAALAKKGQQAPSARATVASRAPSDGLRVTEPNDSFEQEADRVADAVMAVDRTSAAWSLSRLTIDTPVQRKCACGGSEEDECEECKANKRVQRKAAGLTSAHTGEPPLIVHEVLRSPGRPLDTATQHFFEARLAHDLSRVRVHTDDKAGESAKSVNALAYTVGRDVVFGSGKYDPDSNEGRKLLAHELTHTVQQDKAPLVMPISWPVGPANDIAEREAEGKAHDIAANNPAGRMAAGAVGLGLQRQPAPGGKTCSVEVCFVSIKRFELGLAGFKHAVINVDEVSGPKHIEVDPDFHQPKGMLHSHVISANGRKEASDCQTLPATCAEVSQVVAAANVYESKDVIYDPSTTIGPNSNSFAEWALAKAGLSTNNVNVPFGASGWDYFQKNPSERIDPPHVLRSKPTLAGTSAKTAAGGTCTKKYNPATNAAAYVDLVREAESRMTAAGISTNPEKIKILRGLYYGTPWSADFSDQQSASRIAGFETFTGTGVKLPRDPVSLFDCGLYQALQLSQDITARSGKVDVGHLMIALDARNASIMGLPTPNLPFPGFGGSGVEIVTWLGDLGGGAASLALDRARSSKTPPKVSTKFTGTDYGATSNLEGDVAGFLVARSSGGAPGADAPSIPAGKGIADALDEYFATSAGAASAAWDQRARTFLTIYGGTFNGAGDLTNAAQVISGLADKIESFACNYLAQRKADSSSKISDSEVLVAADNIRPCAHEVAETFVNTLVDTSKSPGLPLKATRFPTPRPPSPGACISLKAAIVLKSVKLGGWSPFGDK